MLHRIVLTAASVIALTAAANAADMNGDPAYAAVDWSGLYVGGNGGYGMDASSIGSKMQYTIPVIGKTLDWGVSPAGGFGGGQIGYNAQRGNFVFGVEADFQGSGIAGSKSASLSDVIYGHTVSASVTAGSTLDWFGTVRARLGYAAGSTLIYATAGYAYGQITDTARATASVSGGILPPQTKSWSAVTDGSGWVVGGGVEHKFTPSWSAKAEYQYIDLGQEGDWAKGAGEDYAVHTVRAGLNYHLGASFDPLK